MKMDEEKRKNNRSHFKSDRFSEELEAIYAKRREQQKAVNKKGKKPVKRSQNNHPDVHKKQGRSEPEKQRKRKVRTSSSKGRKRRSTAVRRRQNKYRRRRRIGRIVNLFLVVLCLVGCIYTYHRKKDIRQYLDKVAQRNLSKKETLSAAKKLAEEYDYDAAIEKIKAVDGYEKDKDLTSCISEWEETKENLVGYTAGDVTHIFYHTLVVNTELAFECAPSIAEGFKEWMTTVDEFNKITQTMYDEGYVLCSLYDFFDETYDDDGTPHFTEKTVYLPKGKKPFILSLDDLSYYHTYTGHGMATKLVLDKNGKITCEYEKQDGTTVTGAYDCVPLINAFMEKHPDGAYRGARGTIALTGYNGIFGYRTDESYVTKKDLDEDKKQWLEDHPDYDYDEECKEAKAIADELKAEGWTFASHTWGHIRIGKTSLKKIKVDTKKWLENVEPIIGETECIIFAHGQDLASTDTYDTKTNKKYQYLSSEGFHIFLNVDSHQYTMQVHDEYVHGGRRNLDGYRLWQDAHGYSDWTSDLFKASDILDSRRKDMPQNVD